MEVLEREQRELGGEISSGSDRFQQFREVLRSLRILIVHAGGDSRRLPAYELLDYREPTSKYGLVKAALALSGFSPEAADWTEGITLREMLESFGGGIEITTLAAIPKGSGLGTSSIMGAVILALPKDADIVTPVPEYQPASPDGHG